MFVIFLITNIFDIIFVMSNIKSPKPEQVINRLFETIGKQARIRILLAIGEGEVCGCHLEADLGLRLAYISQQLMALREAGLLLSQRDGRFVFYRLADVRLLELVEQAALISEVLTDDIASSGRRKSKTTCCCPSCSDELITIGTRQTPR